MSDLGSGLGGNDQLRPVVEMTPALRHNLPNPVGRLATLLQVLPSWGLPLATLALLALFSLMLPTTFPTAANLQAVIRDHSVVAILSLGVLLPMIIGKIDLTVGYGVVMWHILAITLQTRFGLPWYGAVASVLVLGAGVGLLNGVLVEIARIDAFIATLGTGTVLYALAIWHTDGQQVTGVLPPVFFGLSAWTVLGIPVSAFYIAVIAAVLWVLTEKTTLGRFLYAVGGNPRAAALNGIPVRPITILAFVLSGLLTGMAGVLMAARLGVGQASAGLEFLLPALVGVFLGTTTILPGRPNVRGTLVGILVLAVGVTGIEQSGGAPYVEPLFDGATLLLSIALAAAGLKLRRAGRLHPRGARPEPHRGGD